MVTKSYYDYCCIPSPLTAFLENNTPNLWAYYCSGQCVDVGNRFFSMPSYRNRILGLQLYKFNIKGLLQWGYNFYYSRCSRYEIDPFVCTDAYGSFPSGDAFSVYPGRKGPIASIRLRVFKHALQDMQAMLLLEKYMSKEEIVALIDSEKNLTFSDYPHSAEFILNFREKVNKLIAVVISSCQ